MDRATREHFIKLMQSKLDEEVQVNLNELEDFEQLGKHLISTKEKESVQESKAIFIEEPKPMKVEEFSEEEEDVLFPESEDDDYELEDLMVEDNLEAISEEALEMEEAEVNPEEETNAFLQTESISLTEQEEIVNDEVTQTDQRVVELQQDNVLEEEQPKTAPPKEVRVIKTEPVQQSQKAKALKEKFDKEFEVLKTMHRLELWELQKQHQKFEQQFTEEYEQRLKNLKD